jgi:hypothetical protein
VLATPFPVTDESGIGRATKRFGPATTLRRTAALSFVIPTGAKRRGGTCGAPVPRLKPLL